MHMPPPSGARGAGRPLRRMRDYVRGMLYCPASGYFTALAPPVLAPLASSPPLASLPSAAAYHAAVAARYAAAPHGWATPAELFTPQLAAALLTRLSATRTQGVVEVGAGRGSLAAALLAAADSGGTALSYTTIEISPALAALQRAALAPWIATGRARVLAGDALSRIPPLPQNTHLLACEVLDNLPHELLRLPTSSTSPAAASAVVAGGIDAGGDGAPAELQWTPGAERDARAALAAFAPPPGAHGGLAAALRGAAARVLHPRGEDAWVPVGAWALLREAARARVCGVTLMDFHALPGASAGVNAPVVQRSRAGGGAREYESVLDAPFGEVDVMFPTDFEGLERAVWAARAEEGAGGDGGAQGEACGDGGSSRVLSQAEFFREYGGEKVLRTATCRDGYNPLVSTFTNASVLLADFD